MTYIDKDAQEAPERYLIPRLGLTLYLSNVYVQKLTRLRGFPSLRYRLSNPSVRTDRETPASL